MGDRPEIRPLRTLDEMRACVALQKLTWGEDCTEIVPVSVLRFLERIGGVAAGAFDGTELVGFVVGFPGMDEEGRPVHWSDMLAVRPGLRDRGLGERLKRHQRDVLLPRGVRHVYWTFDPLEARNAYLNFAHLGAVSGEYLPDYYGDTDSPLHSGTATDRLVADWPIASDRVRLRLAGERPDRDSAAVPALLEAGGGDAPRPLTREPPPEAASLRIMVPADFQTLKAADPALAAEWRAASRAAFQDAFVRGYRALDFLRGYPAGSYLLGMGRGPA